MSYSRFNNELDKSENVGFEGDLKGRSDDIVDRANQAIDDYLSEQNGGYYDYEGYEFDALPPSDNQAINAVTEEGENYAEYWAINEHSDSLKNISVQDTLNKT